MVQYKGVSVRESMERRRYSEGQNRVFMPEQIGSMAESVYNAVDVFNMRRNLIDAQALIIYG